MTAFERALIVLILSPIPPAKIAVRSAAYAIDASRLLSMGAAQAVRIVLQDNGHAAQ
jgi:hypothetical protein